MKFLKSYKVFESSNDEHIRVVRDFLTDLSDDDVVVQVTDLNQYSKTKKISILIGDDNEEDEYMVHPGKIDISKYIETLELVDKYLTDEGYVIEFGHFYNTDNNGNESSFYSDDFIEIKEKLQDLYQMKICEIVYKNLEFVKDYIKECNWDINNSLANCAYFAKDFYHWCQSKSIDCKFLYCEQSASDDVREDHIIPVVDRNLIDFVYTDMGVSHIVRENNKLEALKSQTNPEITKINDFSKKYKRWGYKDPKIISYEKAFGENGLCQTIDLKETIKVPIEIGDTVLGGRFKNKKTIVKKIGKNKKGDITINDKPLLKYRIIKESLQEDVDYYFRHLEDDNFVIQTENDYFRIFKPLNYSDGRPVYSYSNCSSFHWSEIAGEVSRYVSELDDSENSEKSIDYAYVVSKSMSRKQISIQSLIDETFDVGEILSFVIGFK